MTFLDWNDRNAHAAAECAVRLMGDGYDDEGALAEAANRYSCSPRDVIRRLRQIAGGER